MANNNNIRNNLYRIIRLLNGAEKLRISESLQNKLLQSIPINIYPRTNTIPDNALNNRNNTLNTTNNNPAITKKQNYY